MGTIKRILDFFFPRICPICGGRLSLSEEGLCVKCLLELPRTAYIQRPADNLLFGMFQLQVNVRKAVAFMRYLKQSPSTELIKTIKYRNGITLGRFVGRLMAEEFTAAAPDFFEDIDVIVPMPLTKSRFRQRGYNQSALLAHGISSVTGIPVDENAVRRTVFSVSQTKLTSMERRENVKDAFRCVHPERLSGKHILLIDDVLTTGSTLLSLAKSIDKAAENLSFTIVVLATSGETRHI